MTVWKRHPGLICAYMRTFTINCAFIDIDTVFIWVSFISRLTIANVRSQSIMTICICAAWCRHTFINIIALAKTIIFSQNNRSEIKHKIQLYKNNLYKFRAFEAIVANANKRTRCILTRGIFVKGFDASIIRHSWITWGNCIMDHNLWCICELVFQPLPKSHPSPTNLNESHSSISLQKYPFPSNPKKHSQW